MRLLLWWCRSSSHLRLLSSPTGSQAKHVLQNIHYEWSDPVSFLVSCSKTLSLQMYKYTHFLPPMQNKRLLLFCILTGNHFIHVLPVNYNIKHHTNLYLFSIEVLCSSEDIALGTAFTSKLMDVNLTQEERWHDLV